MNYSTLSDKWAVLVRGSSGWDCYRHEADVLAMYQLLRARGYDDDHIILIIANDIAYNDKNLDLGEIRTYTGGNNLYNNVKKITAPTRSRLRIL